jgi:hypothetical protein
MPVAAMSRDWRNAGGYGLADTSPQWFAWEFLRRNAKYMAEWRRFAALGQPKDIDAKIERAHCAIKLALRWGLIYPADPAWFVPPTPASVPRVEWARSAEGVNLPEASDDHLRTVGRRATGKLAITFDISMPIQPQIESATTYLSEQAASWRSANPERAPVPLRAGKADASAFVEMLRILDGEADGAKPAELIAALWPGEANEYPGYPLRKRLNTRRRAAKAYRDGKYRDLAVIGKFHASAARKTQAIA